MSNRMLVFIAAVVAFALISFGQAGDRGNPEQDSPRNESYRVQVMLLEIKPDAPHPKLKELREIAHSGESASALFSRADELVAAGIATIPVNTTNVQQTEYKNSINVVTEVQTRIEPGTPEGSERVAFRTDMISIRIELNLSSGPNGMLTHDCHFEQSSLPGDGQPDRWTFRWNGSWSSKPGVESILVSTFPRPTGGVKSRTTLERYLLFRADPVK